MENKKYLFNWIVATLRESAWAPLSVFGFYLFGLAVHLFDNIPYMDIPTHFMGGVAITYFYRSAIRNSQEFLGEIPLSIQIIFAFTSTGTTAVLWEFYENILDHFFGFHTASKYDQVSSIRRQCRRFSIIPFNAANRSNGTLIVYSASSSSSRSTVASLLRARNAR